jgi:hypothetical protein
MPAYLNRHFQNRELQCRDEQRPFPVAMRPGRRVHRARREHPKGHAARTGKLIQTGRFAGQLKPGQQRNDFPADEAASAPGRDSLPTQHLSVSVDSFFPGMPG